MKALFSYPKRIINCLLGSLILPLSFAVNATPITIGSLSSNDDGTTQIITDSLNNLEWLRWDVIPEYSYAQTVGALGTVAGGGWNIAHNSQAQLFVEALLSSTGDGAPPCNVTNTAICEAFTGPYPQLEGLIGDNYGVDIVERNYAWFLNDDPFGEEVGIIMLKDVDEAHVSKFNSFETIIFTDGYVEGNVFGYAPIPWMLYRTAQVPEPAPLALLGLGIAGLIITRRKRKLPA